MGGVGGGKVTAALTIDRGKAQVNAGHHVTATLD